MAALAAATEVVSRFGFFPTSLQVLGDSNNTVLLLSPYAFVGKVATGHHRRLGHELAVATHIHARGGPVVPPAASPPTQVHRASGIDVTFWEYVRAEPGDCNPESVADAILGVHEALESYPGQLPPVDAELSAVSSLLADPGQATALPAEGRTLLQRGLEQLHRELSDLTWTPRPLHGSPSTGNQILTDATVRFIDFETASLGPVEWDLAHLGDDVIRHYRFEHDEEILRTCRDLVSIKTAAWCWANYSHPDLKWHAHYHLGNVKRLLAKRRTTRAN